MTDTDQQVVPRYQVGSKVYVERGPNQLLGQQVVVHEVILGRTISYRVRSWPTGRIDMTLYEDSLGDRPFAVYEIHVAARATVRLRLPDDDFKALMEMPEDDREDFANDHYDEQGYDEWSFEIGEALYEDIDVTDSKLLLPDEYLAPVDPNQQELPV